MNPTQEQEHAIQTTDRTVLLSAAAGSGKTATLTERLIRMITRERDPLDVSRMLVVTFTRAAAEELRTRISAALSRAVAERPNDEHLARQMLLLPTARIRTIDGFCNEIVKGHTVSLGISPLYRIASEAQVDLLGVKLMNEVIEDAYSGVLAPEGLDIVALVEAVESVRTSGALDTDLYNLYKTKLAALPEGVRILKENADTLAHEATLPLFETRAGRAFSRHYAAHYESRKNALCTLFDALCAAEGEGSRGVLSYRDKALGLMHHYTLVSEAAGRSYGDLKAAVASYTTVKKTTVKDDTPLSKQAEFFGATVEEFAKNCAAERKTTPFPWEEEELSYAFRATSALCRTVYLLLREFEGRFLEEKRRQSICDYADLERYAYTLLWDENGERTPLAHEMAASFDTICIDEYQDVNEMQHRIFEALSTPHNRFMVGDIKQSIYGFRGGEPEIFARLRASFPSLDEEGDEAVLFLTKNFRSERAVIDLANGVFDFLFPIVGEGIGYRTEDRLQTDKEPSESVPPPTFYLMKAPAESEGIEALDKNTLKSENDLIAEHILGLLASGKKKNGDKIQPADVVVMCRGGRAMAELVATLRAYGIPLQTEDKTDFFAHKEILLAVSLCHTVNNPHHDLHLSATLRSPLYGFSLDDLIRVRGAVPRGASLYDGVRALAEAGDERCMHFLADVERFRALAENTPAHRLIRTLFEQTGIYAATQKEGRTRLRIFYELARSYEESAYRGLYRFLQRIAELREFGGSAVDKQTVGKTDAVRVMTIHKSKGLEAPVCILAHTGNSLGGEGKSPTFRFSPEIGLFSAISDETGLATLTTPLSQAVAFAAKEKETDEAIRVLYVALTRAVEQLYVFGSAKKKHLKTMLSDAALIRACPSRAILFEKASYATWMLAALGEDTPLCQIHLLDAPYALPTPVPATQDTPEDEPPADAAAVQGENEANADAAAVQGENEANADAAAVQDENEANADAAAVQGENEANADAAAVQGENEANAD
ncbi:MAG: UvrD-helicase domain-containing protein, partial [Clostridia bacterium]|nr:UvrD-helicase domain-containing protein [Clostridia bacterium]